ncbi:hypothetical protein UFOVP580_8 [uncultured Caudovirales phage]|uniref:Uncharacterized protein n=1 Tax=uncultured Caudovirales phage TaxID=2100421 RepID=A0A6J5P9V1_9CAUD|nr:hypothetical protein UFOVP580_8 [uncultured Caudovirales phage]
MDLSQLANLDPRNLSDEDLAAMSHSSLMAIRKAHEKNRALNVRLAPFEHQAFAREYVKENPISGTLGVGAAIPLYALAKGAGFMSNGGTATPPSMAQMSAGFRGIGQGLGLVK